MLGTVGLDTTGVEAGDTTFILAGGCAAVTFCVLGVVFVCILTLLLREFTVDRVWMAGAYNVT